FQCCSASSLVPPSRSDRTVLPDPEAAKPRRTDSLRGADLGFTGAGSAADAGELGRPGKPMQREALELADELRADAEHLAHEAHRPVRPAVDAEAQDDHLALQLRQPVECAVDERGVESPVELLVECGRGDDVGPWACLADLLVE